MERGYLENPGLLFEVFVFIGLSIRKMVDLDTVLVNLIENLTNMKATKRVMTTNCALVKLEKY